MKKIKDLLLKYRELISYLFFGVCTTLVNIIVYYIFDVFESSTALSTVAAWILSVSFAFVTNKIYVFKSKVKAFKGILREAVSFFSCRLATGVLDLGIMLLFVDYFHFNGLLIKVLSNILVIVLNYVFSKIFIFKHSNRQG